MVHLVAPSSGAAYALRIYRHMLKTARRLPAEDKKRAALQEVCCVVVPAAYELAFGLTQANLIRSRLASFYVMQKADYHT
eukprot:13708-Heterococcus_DN1.PRE.2